MTSESDWHAAMDQAARDGFARYQHEVVEALRVCPWAERARRDGQVSVEVVLAGAEEDALREAAAAVLRHASRDETVIGIVVLPCISLGRSAFERWVARLRDVDASSHAGRAPFALAAFHPEAAFPGDDASAYAMVPFLRRTPDPTVQAVRLSILDDMRGEEHQKRFMPLSALGNLEALLESRPEPPLHERVAEANRAMLRRIGTPSFEARVSSIRRQTRARYAAIGPKPTPDHQASR